MSIEQLIVKLSDDPFNPELNFEVAVEYERLNQTASAVSFYLRTAEYAAQGEEILAYNALLKMAHCFEHQKDRQHTVTNCILQALALMPNRPEAYFLLSQYHERQGNWQEAYTFAELGLVWFEIDVPLPSPVGYHGRYCLLFEKAVSAYWVGRKQESVELFDYLALRKLAPDYEKAVQDNIRRLREIL